MKLLFENWRKFINEQKVFRPDRVGLYLFDFDDTLAVTSCRLNVIYKDGRVEPLATGEFEQRRAELEKAESEGEISFDEFCHLGEEDEFEYLPAMSDFKDVLNNVMKQGSFMKNEVAILTARQPQVEVPIKNKLEKDQGIPGASYRVYGVEGGGPQKARKVVELLNAGNYDFVYFADDSQDNLDAVGRVVADYGIEYQPVLVAHGGLR
jgi:hypothetical protein